MCDNAVQLGRRCRNTRSRVRLSVNTSVLRAHIVVALHMLSIVFFWCSLINESGLRCISPHLIYTDRTEIAVATRVHT